MQEDRGLLARLGSSVRWLLLAVLVCAAGVVVFRQVVANRLDEEIRVHVESMIAEHYRGLDVRIEGARRIEGKGIEIRSLYIRSRDGEKGRRNLLYIGEMFLECRADLTELLMGKPEVRRLIVRRMKVHATCCPEGRWNVAQLLPPPDFGGSVPAIVMEDSTLELQDLCRQKGGVWTLRGINLKAVSGTDSQAAQRWEFAGNLQGDHFKRVKIKGFVDPEHGRWSAWGTLDELDMSQRLLDVVPNDIAKYASLLTSLQTRAHFEFGLSHEPGDTEPFRAWVKGHLSDGRVDDPRLPLPLTKVEADVFCDNQQIRLEHVTARSGDTQLQLECRCENYLTDSPQLHLTASVDRLPLDDRLFEVLPERFHDGWRKFSPAGIVDADVSCRLENNRLVPNVTVTCHDVSFAYEKFPLRMRNGRGIVHWVGDELHIRDFTARAGNQVVHMSGQFQNPGPQSTGWLEMNSAGPVELDEELILAMNETGQKIVRSLHPTGKITLIRGRIDKRVPGEKPNTRWEIALNDCSVQYDRFPYAIHKITGKLILENRRWDFEDLKGHHGSSYITCSGAWVPMFPSAPGGDLIMNFKCWDVPLNDSLRNAVGKLNAGAERFWNSMRPRGTIDYANITLNFNSLSKQTSIDLLADKWPPEKNIEGRSITVHPAWFPLRLDDCTGRVRFINGQFSLENVAARRGNSRIELAGQGRVLRGEKWEVAISRINTDLMQMDHELMDALPEAVRSSVRQLKYEGNLSLNGNAWFRGGTGQPLYSGWDVLLDIDNGSINNQLKLENIYGGVRLTGSKDVNGFQSRGELEIDSLMTRGIQITQVKGPLWFDSRQLLLGSRASVVKRGSPPQQVTARAMGGVAGIDAHVILDQQKRFAIDISVSNAEVTEFARSFHSQRHDISGKVYALVRLKGAGAGLHTLQGTGQLRLREADIYQLPVMVQMLNQLKPRRPDTTGFTSGDVDFRLQGEQITFDRVDFMGDLFSLKGSGWMDLNRRLDLKFYALVGGEEFQLPVIRTLLAQASKNILLIQVVGDVNNPDVIKKPLPAWDDTLQRFFPEAAARTAER